MKKIAIISSAALFCLAAGMAVSLSAQGGGATFTGEIMDSPCAILGGHDKMALKDENDKDCTIRCVKMGGKYALVDAANKTWYQLDDQKKAEPFAGAKVTITGTADAATKTIRIATIKAAT
jgi:type 1 fimbria pilin